MATDFIRHLVMRYGKKQGPDSILIYERPVFP